MSLERVHLRKLLKLFYLPANKRTSALRKDIRDERKKERGEDTGGGDFHGPFWADAKRHVAGELDLRVQAKSRVDANKSRERLYPRLTEGFLSWWNERRRWRNEVFEFIPGSISAHYSVREFGGVVKVENLLSLKIGDRYSRIIYPYFSEEPRLSAEGARIGLWLLGEALPRFQREDFRILDILRGASFAAIDHPLNGSERDLFLRNYESVLKEWTKLWDEYEP